MFSDLPAADLTALCGMIAEITLSPGEIVFSEGAPADKAYIIRKGQVEIIKQSAGQEVLLAIRQQGEIIGEMALLEAAPRSATAKARTRLDLLAIPRDRFDKLLNTSPSAARVMLNTVTVRLRSTEALLSQSEKMSQLGTLAAGMAHELNNPASAVQRGAEQISNHLDNLYTTLPLLLPAQEQSRMDRFARLARSRAENGIPADPVEIAGLEADLEVRLERAGVAQPWEAASILAQMGLSQTELNDLFQEEHSSQPQQSIQLLIDLYSLISLLQEVRQGANRISEIVEALKRYIYLDQAPVQRVDLHESLENTLVLLRSRQKKEVRIIREYDQQKLVLEAYAGELNQVWTNILDNAIDAVAGKGEIILRTRQEAGWIVVEIEDNGPGIPTEDLSKIFNPFYTTKPPGEGTGLGLNISYNIIQKHNGRIEVFSRPGKTRFRIHLPVTLSETHKTTVPGRSNMEMEDSQIEGILAASRTIAIVGISDQYDRTSNRIGAYLQRHGYRIIPVNPQVTRVLGETSLADLRSIQDPVDIVLVFRRAEFAPQIARDAVEIGAQTLWLQEGIISEEAADIAREAGLNFLMDVCIRTTHQRLFKEPMSG